VAVSNASSAWSTSFSDRSARVSQLTAAVQSGTYNVSSAAISQSLVASATA
jgi:anti-sigma28 factor (negative regulator of flagellin synthesis)